MKRCGRLFLPLLVVALLPVSACGQDSIDRYCGELRAHQKEMAAMIDSTSAAVMLNHLPMLHDLADKAPDDLTDEWQVFTGALDHLDRAIDSAGVKPSDFVDGKPPAGLSAGERQAIADAADQVSSEDVVQAANGIEQQGRDVCKVNLGLA